MNNIFYVNAKKKIKVDLHQKKVNKGKQKDFLFHYKSENKLL